MYYFELNSRRQASTIISGICPGEADNFESNVHSEDGVVVYSQCWPPSCIAKMNSTTT